MSKARDTYWNPLVPLCLFVYFIARSYSAGLSAFRGFALITMALWLGLAIYNRISKGKFTAWLYSDGE
jgi:hypothetical protein